jgi:hypothetical protein
MKLKVLPLALAFGVLSGIGVFVMALLALYADYGLGLIALVADVYPYFELNLTGAFVGLLFGFIDGFIGGLLIALLYNLFGGCCCCKGKGKGKGSECC